MFDYIFKIAINWCFPTYIIFMVLKAVEFVPSLTTDWIFYFLNFFNWCQLKVIVMEHYVDL